MLNSLVPSVMELCWGEGRGVTQYIQYKMMVYNNVRYPVLVFMNIVLRLKSWYLAEKQVFPSKLCRGGTCTSHTKKLKQT